jgi:hypothetical protein
MLEPDPPAYISLDPGASPKGTGLTGYATWDAEGHSLDITYYPENEIKRQFLKDVTGNRIDSVICETWKLDPKTAKVFSWSPMPTPKLIGWIEGVCQILEINFHLQEPGIKKTGYLHWGKGPLPHSNPMNHAYDAFVHGREFLIKQGIIQP